MSTLRLLSYRQTGSRERNERNSTTRQVGIIQRSKTERTKQREPTPTLPYLVFRFATEHPLSSPPSELRQFLQSQEWGLADARKGSLTEVPVLMTFFASLIRFPDCVSHNCTRCRSHKNALSVTGLKNREKCRLSAKEHHGSTRSQEQSACELESGKTERADDYRKKNKGRHHKDVRQTT